MAFIHNFLTKTSTIISKLIAFTCSVQLGAAANVIEAHHQTKIWIPHHLLTEAINRQVLVVHIAQEAHQNPHHFRR